MNRIGRIAVRGAAVGVGAGALAIALACMGEIEGERAANGGLCPEGEVCTEDGPDGLVFVGQAFFEAQASPRFGPVLSGGRFQLGFRAYGDGELGDWAYTLDTPDVFSAARGLTAFEPVDESGASAYPVDGYVDLAGVAPGTTYLRIVDPDTGALIDRIALDVVALRDVTLKFLDHPDRPYFIAGCEETIGVRLVADDEAGTELRAFDLDLSFRADGVEQPELMYWDCYTYVPPADRDEVTLTVDAVGRTWTWTLPVMQLPSCL